MEQEQEQDTPVETPQKKVRYEKDCISRKKSAITKKKNLEELKEKARLYDELQQVPKPKQIKRPTASDFYSFMNGT